MPFALRRAAVVVCLSAVGSLAWAQAPSAQAPPAAANPWIHVTRVTIQPGGVAEFEEYVKKIAAGRLKLGLPNPVWVYQVALGGSPFTYDFVMPFAKWEEMDAIPTVPGVLMKAYGEVEGAKLLKAGRSVVESVTIEVYRLRLDLSTNPNLGAPPSAYVTLTVTEHHGETLPSYLRILGKIKKAEEQDPKAPMVMRYVLNAGEGAVTVAARSSKTLAERTTWPNQGEILRKFYGEDEDREMGDAITRSIAKRSSITLAYRADLSALPKQAPSSQP